MSTTSPLRLLICLGDRLTAAHAAFKAARGVDIESRRGELTAVQDECMNRVDVDKRDAVFECCLRELSGRPVHPLAPAEAFRLVDRLIAVLVAGSNYRPAVRFEEIADRNRPAEVRKELIERFNFENNIGSEWAKVRRPIVLELTATPAPVPIAATTPTSPADHDKTGDVAAQAERVRNLPQAQRKAVGEYLEALGELERLIDGPPVSWQALYDLVPNPTQDNAESWERTAFNGLTAAGIPTFARPGGVESRSAERANGTKRKKAENR